MTVQGTVQGTVQETLHGTLHGARLAAPLALTIALTITLTLGAGSAAAQPPALDAAVCGPPLAETALAPSPVTPLPKFAAALEAGAATILAIGSSSTAGVGAGAPELGYPQRLAAALAAAYPAAAISMTAKGVGGEVASGARARLSEHFQTDWPDLILWQVGTNDALRDEPLAAFESVLADGLTEIVWTQADVLLIDPQHLPGRAADPRYAAFTAAVDAAAAATAAGLVPRYARMAAAAEAHGGALMAPDGLHMNAAGHACLAGDLLALIRAGVAAAP